MKYTIFSIDKADDIVHRVGFENWMLAQPTQGNMMKLIGCYDGKIERSYICLTEDFNEFVVANGLVDGQYTVLEMSGCNKRYVDIMYLWNTSNGEPIEVREYLGTMHCVTHGEAVANGDWSYRPDMDKWYIIKDDNPDVPLGTAKLGEKL